MFWKKRHRSAGRGSSARNSIAQALEAMGNPDGWENLDEQTLGAVAFARYSAYGNQPTPEAVPELHKLHSVLLRRALVGGRLRLEQMLAESIEIGRSKVCALLPGLPFQMRPNPRTCRIQTGPGFGGQVNAACGVS